MAMLVCVGVSIYLMADELNLGFAGLVKTVKESSMSQIYFSDPRDDKFFWKQFASGAFITIVMTGLDQDLMQKNLSCRNLGDAQKNMFWFTIAIVIVNVFFLSLGVLLYQYAAAKGIALPTNAATGKVIGDNVFPLLATNHFTLFAGVVFILGIIAVTYASADSALTALTTSFCVDMLDIKQYDESRQKRMRQLTHFGFSLVLIVIILIFRAINDQSVITAVFKAAGYTYGPLLGLYSFGLFTKRGVHDRLVLPVCIATPLITYFINANSKAWWGYEFGFEILILNGLLTFVGLLAISRERTAAELNPAV
jgi:Na+/proline symporter